MDEAVLTAGVRKDTLSGHSDSNVSCGKPSPNPLLTFASYYSIFSSDDQ